MKSLLSLRNPVLCLATGGILSTAYSAPSLDLLNAFTFADGAKQGGIEIVSYTPDNFTVAGIYVSDPDGEDSNPATFGVQVLDLGSTGALTERFQIDLNPANTGLNALSSMSSVALDPLGRDFGVVTVIPSDNTGTPGKLAFFNYNTGTVLSTLSVGYHPDSVRFSADGNTLYVANEGEFKASSAQAPGSISIVNVANINLSNISGSTTTQTSIFQGPISPQA